MTRERAADVLGMAVSYDTAWNLLRRIRKAMENRDADNLTPGSTVETDGYKSYRKPLEKDYTHHAENFSPDSDHLKWLHTLTGNAKAFINGTYHGTSTKHLQMYLSEFCYRFNRRRFHGDIFDRLLAAAIG